MFNLAKATGLAPINELFTMKNIIAYIIYSTMFMVLMVIAISIGAGIGQLTAPGWGVLVALLLIPTFWYGLFYVTYVKAV